MWPWSTINRLQREVDSLRDQRDSSTKNGMLVRELLERRNARLEEDLDALRSDHRRLIDKMTAMAANGGSGRLDLTRDPFAEDPRQPDEWVTPDLNGDFDAASLLAGPPTDEPAAQAS